jgi:hypothetical protein
MSYAGGGGGGWGAAGGNTYASANIAPAYKLGGVGGKAVALNGFVATWAVVGTRYGAIA